MNYGVVLLVLLGLCGCGEGEMAVQGKYKPYRPALLFGDKSSNQPAPEGAVARGDGARAAQVFQRPPMTAALLARGQERYHIFCAPCHGRDGAGNGLIPQRGYPRPPNLHETRVRAASDRALVDVIAHGSGVMFSYAARVPAEDRWAIVAYIRALQLSQNVAVADLSAEERLLVEQAP